jgi:hypothetical protein
MATEHRSDRQWTGPGSDSDSRAIDRYEDEGGPGPGDRRGRGRDAPTGDREVGDPGRVVVTPGSTPDACQVHHRDIPELHADGATLREAVANLDQDLAREVEGVADHHRRELFGRVLDDVRAFAAHGPWPPPTAGAPRRDRPGTVQEER